MITPKELTPERAEQIYIGHAAWRGPVADMLADALAGWQFERNRREAEVADAAKIVDALVAIHNAALRDLRSVRALVESERANADQCLAELNAMGEQLTAAERERDEARAALARARALLEARLPRHSGSCCTFDADGRVIVTQESCMCPDLARETRAFLADTNTSEADAATPSSSSLSPAKAPTEPAPPCPRCDALIEALRALVCYCEGPVTIASFGGNLDRAKKAIAAHGGGK
jgi:hypothetical protein